MLFETLLFLWLKKQKETEHTLFVHLRVFFFKAGELQGLRENLMSSGGFFPCHTDSSIKLQSLPTLYHSVISVIINQTTPRSTLINLGAYCKFQVRRLCSCQSSAGRSASGPQVEMMISFRYASSELSESISLIALTSQGPLLNSQTQRKFSFIFFYSYKKVIVSQIF